MKRAGLGSGSKEVRPLAIDLCCGKGGWTRGLIDAGFRVVGFDIVLFREYPGELVVQDVKTLDGRQFRHAELIVCSPPCQEFSRHDMPWTRRRCPPPPDLSIVEACVRIGLDASSAKGKPIPFVLENVRGSRKWLIPLLGTPRRCGSFWLYGDVPVLLPKIYMGGVAGVADRELARRLKKRYSPKGGHPPLRPGEHVAKSRMPHRPADRALIPFEIARWIGDVYMP